MADRDDLADAILADVRAALAIDVPSQRDDALDAVLREVYDLINEGNDAGRERFVSQLASAVVHTVPDGSEEQATRIASIIATAALNAVAADNAPVGATLRWITMQDDRVRDLHVPMHGVETAAGTPFNVGGFPLFYPGQPVGPPEVWINCRCRVNVSSVTAASTAVPAAAMSAHPDSLESAAEGSGGPDAVPQEEPMPYQLGDRGSYGCDGFPVLVQDDSGLKLAPGGCHATRADAVDHLSALKMNVTEASAADDTLVARSYSAEQRRKMAKRGTAMPDGSFPIADEEDLRNAIQAIGRAKDPDAAKRHIRKRARALGLTNLLPESWTASGEPDEPLAAATAPRGVNTHDAPGWITNPRETQRLRTYWTRGAGAAKIGWGAPGDFNRCRRHLGKYVATPYLAGTCANLHYVALGFWPGQPPHGRRKHHSRVGAADETFNNTEEFEAVTAAFQAAAELVDDELPPREWFDDPHFDGPTPLTVTSDGRVLGHLATWGTCHVGIGDRCVTAAPSKRNYADFLTGEVDTADGTVAVGNITMDTGHAPTDLGPQAAVHHYDDTGTVVADVAAGEDEYGIWVAGQVRPGVSDQMRRALRAGALSGDWRRIGGNLELVAALVVNVPGFPIPRVQVASAGERDLALVAAAIVTTDANADADRIAAAVIHQMDERDEREKRRKRYYKLDSEMRAMRAAALLEAIEV